MSQSDTKESEVTVQTKEVVVEAPPVSDSSSYSLEFLKFWKNPGFQEHTTGTKFIIDLFTYNMRDYHRRQLVIFKYFLDIRPNIIAVGLVLSTLFVAIGTIKLKRSFLRTLRNSTFSFFGLGTILVPEVFNPFILELECQECKAHELALRKK